MNMHIYCDSMSVSPIQGDELQLYLYGVDKDHLKEALTDAFSLKEILDLYDIDVVKGFLDGCEIS